MYLFDSQLRLKKYDHVADIVDEFYCVRLAAYEKRRQHLMKTAEKDLVVLSNKARYILETLSGQIDLRHKTAAEIDNLLMCKNFDKTSTNDSDITNGSYDYLLRLRMDSVSKERAQKIVQERDNLQQELAQLRSTTSEQMWLGELQVLAQEYATATTEAAATTAISSATAILDTPTKTKKSTKKRVNN